MTKRNPDHVEGLLAGFIIAALETPDPEGFLGHLLGGSTFTLPEGWSATVLADQLLDLVRRRDQLEADVPDDESLTGLLDDLDRPRTARGLEAVRQALLDEVYSELDRLVTRIIEADAARQPPHLEAAGS